MNTLSVICPVLNEITFMDLWFQSVLKFADEIIIIDGGSRDGTRGKICEYMRKHPNIVKFDIYRQTQSGRPYIDWNRSEVHNALLNEATKDFVVLIDADEMLSDNFDKSKLDLNHCYSFNFVPFWRDIETVRVSIPADARWHGLRIRRLFATSKVKYVQNPVKRKHGSFQCSLGMENLDVDLFHMHYAFETFGHSLKMYDNRRGDFASYIGQPKVLPKPYNYDYSSHHPDLYGKDYKIAIEPYKGTYPELLRKYL